MNKREGRGEAIGGVVSSLDGKNRSHDVHGVETWVTPSCFM